MPALSGVFSAGSFVPPNGLKPVDCACSGACADADGAEDSGDEPATELPPLRVPAPEPKGPVGCAETGDDAAGLISDASLLPKEDVGWNGRTLDPANPVDCALRYGAEIEVEVGAVEPPPLLDEKERDEKGPAREVGEVVAEALAFAAAVENVCWFAVPKGEVGADDEAVAALPARARSDAMSAKRPPVFCEMSGPVAPPFAAAASFSRCCATKAEKASCFLGGSAA